MVRSTTIDFAQLNTGSPPKELYHWQRQNGHEKTHRNA
jgi:hypothetical protein